jgi:hypothetical protein
MKLCKAVRRPWFTTNLDGLVVDKEEEKVTRTRMRSNLILKNIDSRVQRRTREGIEVGEDWWRTFDIEPLASRAGRFLEPYAVIKIRCSFKEHIIGKWLRNETVSEDCTRNHQMRTGNTNKKCRATTSIANPIALYKLYNT